MGSRAAAGGGKRQRVLRLVLGVFDSESSPIDMPMKQTNKSWFKTTEKLKTRREKGVSKKHTPGTTIIGQQSQQNVWGN